MRALVVIALLVVTSAHAQYSGYGQRHLQCDSISQGWQDPQDRARIKAECVKQWEMYPQSRCGGDNIPCGGKCYSQSSLQTCVAGIIYCTPEGQRELRCSKYSDQIAAEAAAARSGRPDVRAAQEQRMHNCVNHAGSLTGEARRSFMSSCLQNSGGQQQAHAPAKTKSAPSFPKTMLYRDVRQRLVASGWRPDKQPAGGGCPWDACRAFPETSDCYGTGRAPCVYTWKREAEYLKVTAIGEGDQYFDSAERCDALAYDRNFGFKCVVH